MPPAQPPIELPIFINPPADSGYDDYDTVGKLLYITEVHFALEIPNDDELKRLLRHARFHGQNMLVFADATTAKGKVIYNVFGDEMLLSRWNRREYRKSGPPEDERRNP